MLDSVAGRPTRQQGPHEPVQQKALAHGFSPANITNPIRDHADSAFVRHQQQGLTVNITFTCDVGESAIIDELLNVWGRAR